MNSLKIGLIEYNQLLHELKYQTALENMRRLENKREAFEKDDEVGVTFMR